MDDNRLLISVPYGGETRRRASPFSGGAGSPRESEPSESEDRQPPRLILIVDDDPAIRSTVSEILDMEGYPVETAANGLEALAKVHEVKPWLIILDMRMPIMDGWDFARNLRAEGIKIPILVMTAAQNARRWAEEIGANSFIPKPFDLDELLNAVNRFLDSPEPND